MLATIRPGTGGGRPRLPSGPATAAAGTAYNPFNAGNYYILANLFWDQQRREEALELYRFAACLEDKDEQLVRTISPPLVGCTRPRICYGCLASGCAAWVPVRAGRFGLCVGLWRIEPGARGLRGVGGRPTATARGRRILLYAAPICAPATAIRSGGAAGDCQRTSAGDGLVRTAADFAVNQGNQAKAPGLWQQVLEVEPLALDGHRAAAQFLAETAGRGAALEHLRKCCERFPHHFELHRLYVEWLREEGAPCWSRWYGG